MAFGTSSSCWHPTPNAGRCLTGFIWWRTCPRSVVPSNVCSRPKPCSGRVKSMLPDPCLLTANARMLTTFASTLRSIVTALSTISIIKRSRFAPLALGLWNRPSSKLTVALKFQVRAWKRENVPQVLAHRCAYLNNRLSVA